MKKSTSRMIDRLVIMATAVIFCIALFVLFREFANVSLDDVAASFAALPARRLLAAAGLTAASYLFLAGYDFLALRYVGRKLRLRDIAYTSFACFAFSNSIGFQFLSGGSLRYRIYSGFGLKAVEIGEIVVFCTFTYVLGVVTVGGLLALFNPAAMASLLHLTQGLTMAIGAGLIAVTAVWLLVAAAWRRPIVIGRYRLRPPSLSLALAQVTFASVDAVLAATVMYVLLPDDPGLRFWPFLNVYLIAATAAVLSEVPSGLGVFESIVTLMTAPESKAAQLSALVAYRMIYYIAPLAIAMALFAWREFRIWSSGRPPSTPQGGYPIRKP